MRLPRVRIARRLIIAATIMVIVVGAERMRRRWATCRERAAYHAERRRDYRGVGADLEREAEDDPALRAVLRFDAERHRRAADWHAEREAEDRRAAWRFWEPIPTDRPDAPWPPIPPELYPVAETEPPAHPGPPRASLVESLLFHPRKYVEAEWPAPDPTIEDVWFTTPEGLRLNGWFTEADRPRAVVLYAEGNAGNIAGRRSVLRLFRERMGASVLIFDYRGYGRSEGSPSEAGILTDARAARRWLAGRAGVAEAEIVLVGHSLGGAVMVDLAARDGARGLVLENTFSSVHDAAAPHLPPWVVRLLPESRLDSLAKIGDYKGPLLQTHGDADDVIPFELGRRLFDRANEPKRFVRIPRGGHNDPPKPRYVDALTQFLDGLPEPRRPEPDGGRSSSGR